MLVGISNVKKSTEQNKRMPSKKKPPTDLAIDLQVDEQSLFAQVAQIIETRKYRAGAYANREVTLMYWEIGRYINSVVLGEQRAAYGKRIVATLSQQLVEKYGKSFEYTKVTRMVKFAELFPDPEILPTLSAKLSWSHIIELLPLKKVEAQSYYINDVIQRNLGVHELRRQISRKAYERQEIANTALTEQSTVPFNMFKDPYLLDLFGLKDNYLEDDLEKAILADIEAFILEFGRGFTFADRQKRPMPILNWLGKDCRGLRKRAVFAASCQGCLWG